VQKEDEVKGMATYRRSSTALLALVLGLAAAAPTAFAQNTNPTILPSSTVLFGKTYGDWSAEWWRWALSVPAATNPVADTTGAHCGEGQSGQVWFLAGTFGGAVTRACTVPSDKHLFFPVLNAVFGAAVGDCTGPADCDVAALRAGAAAFVENPRQLQADIDRVRLGKSDLLAFRVQSPEFTVQVPEGAIFGLPKGAFRPNVSDGYWLLLAPLSPGAHTIHIKGVMNSGFTSEVTYNLTVR